MTTDNDANNGFTLKSSAFVDGGVIPRQCGYKNANKSPPLEIAGIPHSTASLALIMDDPDAMGVVGKIWVHWILYNIEPSGTTSKQIPEGSVPEGCNQGKTDFGESGYGGPAPPDKEHTYIFKLYALDKRLDGISDPTKKEIEGAIQGHIIEQTTLKGRYAP